MLTLLPMGKPALCCKEKVSEIKEGGGGQRKSSFHLFMVTCQIVPAQGSLGGHMKEPRHRRVSKSHLAQPILKREWGGGVQLKRTLSNTFPWEGIMNPRISDPDHPVTPSRA